MSMRPYSCIAASTTRLTLSGSLTSVGTKRQVPPLLETAARAASPLDASNSAMTTRAPSCANSSTHARPMPAPPPVMIATFPASLLARSLIRTLQFGNVVGLGLFMERGELDAAEIMVGIERTNPRIVTGHDALDGAA